MDIHYNAFISYRHHPEDIKVAEQIHKGLEHYVIPKALKKQNHAKLRLFRDKEELPITSNLTDDITRALRNSDFLIVICSTHTKESIWVQREIETFLQTHDHSRVLTVIVNGEPYDVIPQLLCSAEQINPVTGEKTLLPIEPLSCDWRVGKRKAYREELPRLAAALLGCGYDELRQRERQYRMRRRMRILSGALVLLLAFLTYAIYNSMQLQKANDRLTLANIEIQKNLEEAQINQSQYLASASAQQLEAGDRMLAIALAMAALPEYEGERPYVAQAEYALSDAVGVYLAEPENATVGTITCDGLIKLFEATNQRDYMFAFDQRRVLSVWDLKTYQKQASVQMQTSVSQMLVTAQDCVVLFDNNWTLHCYDTQLNLLWQLGGCNGVVPSVEADVLLVELADNRIAFVDASTGQVLRQTQPIELVPGDLQGGMNITFCQKSYDPDAPLLLEYSAYNAQERRVIRVDLAAGQINRVCSVDASMQIRTTGLTEEGTVLTLVAEEAGMWNGSYGQMMTHSPVGIQLICCTETGEHLWTAELTSYSYNADAILYPIPGTGRLFCMVDNLLAVLDSKTGQVLGTCETGATPVWAQTNENFAQIILEDGSVGSYFYENNEFNSYRMLKEDIEKAFAGKGVFAKQTYSSQILVYGSITDENWKIFEGDYDPTVSHRAVWKNLVAIDNYKSICLFDAEKQTLLWTLPEEDGEDYQLLEFSQDGTRLWLGNKGKELLGVDVATGQCEHYPLPERTAEDHPFFYSAYFRMCMTEERICILGKDLDTDEYYVMTFDTNGGDITCTQVCAPVGDAYDSEAVILTERDGIAYLWENSNATLYRVHTDTGSVETFLENVTNLPVVQFLNDGNTYMVSAGNRVSFYSTDDTPLFSVELEDRKGVSAYRTEQQILLLTDAGEVIRYDPDGKKQGELDGYLYTSFFSELLLDFEPEEIVWRQTGDGDLFLNIFDSGNLIDMDSWSARAWVPNCVTYLPELDRFVTTGQDGQTGQKRLGIYPRYDLEDIRQKAQKALNGYTLTQEQKTMYGISG